MKPIKYLILFLLISNNYYSQEKDEIIVKNFGFCLCVKNYNYKLLLNEGSTSAYIQNSSLTKAQIKEIKNIVDNYTQKNYKKSYDNKTKLVLFNCLEMYNNENYKKEIKKITEMNK